MRGQNLGYCITLANGLYSPVLPYRHDYYNRLTVISMKSSSSTAWAERRGCFLPRCGGMVSRCGKARNEISVSFSITVKNKHSLANWIYCWHSVQINAANIILIRYDTGVCENINILTFIRRNTNYQDLSQKNDLGLNFKQIDRC